METSKALCQEKVPTSNDALETNQKVVCSEIEKFACLQLDEEEKKHETDVFMEDGDVAPSFVSDQETKDGGCSSVKETIKDETLEREEKNEQLPPKENNRGSWKRRQEKMVASYRRKREKRRQQSPEESEDFDLGKTLSFLMERTREAEAKMDTPWQSSDPWSGFPKDAMLGGRKLSRESFRWV